MTLRTTMSVFTLLVAFAAVEGQTKQSSKGRKPPVIRETVTVKGDLPPAETQIRETDVNIWRELKFPEHKLTIQIPARASDDMNMDEPDADGLWSVVSDTEKATYRIVVRKLGGILDSKAAAEVLDASISAAYG
ncbi:MAG: hypothetical protein PSX80_02745 [bacterium]|nr:hypothetical protein [bacterium]